MSKRSERREADRQARKLACAEVRTQQNAAAAQPAAIAETLEIKPISEAQLNANRANAQLSRGAVTPEGKAASSRNALKTGLTGRTVLLPTDDASEYNRRLESALARHRPATEEEQSLVQSVVDIEWRLDRVVTLETGIYAKGAAEFVDKFKDEPQAHRRILIQTETYLKYEKSLRNLHIQEARLQRQRTKDLAELKRLKDDRARQEIMLQTAQRTTHPAKTAAAGKNGFEFATPEFAAETVPLSHPLDNQAAAAHS
ncbi:MAG TPA: hypothetical protein VG273_13665 [Bryobacteraceae bacterium]|nr:hypothetical protein [Bryobacteraceae bacterium]